MAGAYDFRTLSPLDFEELVRDLLQAEWACRLESFGPGRDQGIDVRFLAGPHKVIIQAKHFLGSGYPALLRAVAEEREKALNLTPTRYLLATSVSLTAARKDAIVAALAGIPITPHDIMGQEDLNNLIGRHKSIERKHFKLWLSSTAVLERILHSGVYNRTAAEMDIIRAMIPRFVQNASVTDAEQKLAETGTLIIAGQPGVGKTTLARTLVWLHAEQEWNVFVVDSLDEAFRVADTTEKRLILLDDFLGQVRLSADHVRGIDARLPPLISRVAAHDNLRFILTTRDYILAQARELSARLAPDQINAREYVLNVGTYTRAVRARILYNHIYFSVLTDTQCKSLLDDDFYLKIIDHKNFNPRIIEEVTKPGYLALTDQPIRETIEHVLANPEILWERPYRQHLNEDGRAMMIGLFLAGRHAGLDALKASYLRMARAFEIPLAAADVEPRFRATYKSLEGSVLGLLSGIVLFANPGIADFLQSVIVRDRLFGCLLPQIARRIELATLWSIFIGTDPDVAERGRYAAKWTDALDRVVANEDATIFEHAELAAELCAELDHEPLEARLENALDSLEGYEMDGEDVTAACSLLERSFGVILPPHLEMRFRTIATVSGARLLSEYARVLSFEDIQSLDEALHSYGNDDSRSTQASHEAFESFAKDISDELSQIDSIEELDQYEENLSEFMRKRGFMSYRLTSAIDRHRDHLLEEGNMEPSGVYRPASGRTNSDVMSDHAIRSMFGSLK